MKTLAASVLMVLQAIATFASELPAFTTHPQKLLVPPGSNAVFTVVCTNAIAFQWRANGVDLPGETNATLVISDAQVSHSGYYLAIARNNAGWTPSQMAYLSVVSGGGGQVPLNNNGLTSARVYTQGCDFPQPPATNASAQLLAGPQLDQLEPIGDPVRVSNGYYLTSPRTVPTVAPGQTVYCRVQILHTNNPCWGWYTNLQESSVLKIIAGTNGGALPAVTAITYPAHLEWPDVTFPGLLGYPFSFPAPPTNQVRVLGETINFRLPFFNFFSYAPAPYPPVQWRKDGVDIPGATNVILTITNMQISDVGIYDALVKGGYGSDLQLSLKYAFGLTAEGGAGELRSPRVAGVNWVLDFAGAPTRSYDIETSSNLLDWTRVLTLSNLSGKVTLTNPASSLPKQFFRSRLLP